MPDETQLPDQQPQPTRAIAKTQFQDSDWELVGVPSENALKALKAFCLGLVGTPFLPKSLVKDQTPDQQAGTMLAVCLTGREMGFSAMQSLRNFWLSPDGRLGMYAEGLFALMLKNGAQFEWLQVDNQGAKLKTTRGKNIYVSEFTIEDAQRAGLTGKDVWKKFPRAMCKSRVGGDTFRTLFADLGGSQTYTKEEIMDMEEDGPGEYTSAREKAEAAADKKAESDPNLEVVVGPSTAKRGRGKPKEEPVVEVKAQEAPFDLSPQEARNANFLAAQSKEKEKEEPAKPAPTNTTPLDAEKTAIRARMEEIRKAISPGFGLAEVSLIIRSFYGDAGAQTPKQVTIALDAIESALESQAGAAWKSIAKDDPRAAGKNLRTAMDSHPIEIPEPEQAKPALPADFIPGFTWGDKTVFLAREIMAKRKLEEIKFANIMRTYNIHEMPEGEAVIWLLLYWFSTDAVILVKRTTAKGKTAADALDLIEAELKSPLSKESNTLAVERALTNAMNEMAE